ncbi:YraN family protein [Rhodopila sp.]|uniref:YraN family protein n=1 Tax=Rhodopila sp. TaxID=2480087 RepID=UPI002D8001AD|nr:YraN family protein [Rhodopila sp.]
MRPLTSHAAGLAAEATARRAIEADGWAVLGQRVRTPAGEIDLIADKEGLLAIIEVKARPTLAQAAAALTRRQMNRLTAACEMLLCLHPDWGRKGVRFDVILVDPAGRVRRIRDAFRVGDPMD